MMRVKTLSKDKFVSLEVYRKEKKVLPLPVVARRSKTLLFSISAPLKHSKKEKRFPVCIKSVSEHLVFFWFELVLRSFPFKGKRK